MTFISCCLPSGIGSADVPRLAEQLLHLQHGAREMYNINYQSIDRPSELLQVGDLISVRGFGRFFILRENRVTKNGKFKLTLDKMIHK